MTGALCAVAAVLSAAAGCECGMHRPHPLIRWAARALIVTVLAGLTAAVAWVGMRLCGGVLHYTSTPLTFVYPSVPGCDTLG